MRGARWWKEYWCWFRGHNMQKSYVGPDGTEMRCLRCGQVEWESASRDSAPPAALEHFEIAGPWELETTEDGTLTITTPTHVIVVRDVESLEVEES